MDAKESEKVQIAEDAHFCPISECVWGHMICPCCLAHFMKAYGEKPMRGASIMDENEKLIIEVEKFSQLRVGPIIEIQHH